MWPDLLRAAPPVRELDVPITIHLAQSQAEVAAIAGRYGGHARRISRLAFIAPDLLAAHHASSDGDLKLMAARGTTVLNCPRVFARAGVAAAFGRFAGHGVTTVVATDGYNMDLLGELNAASMISKIASARADVANAPDLIASVGHGNGCGAHQAARPRDDRPAQPPTSRSSI
jgi:cytosine/adenosine deaminase-related metal-dependent hydrolase